MLGKKGGGMKRKYWLTGANDGLGASLAEALLQTGAQLAISSPQACQTLSQRYPEHVLAVPGNLTDGQTVREIGEQINRQWGALDTVIINAGTAEHVDGQPADDSLIEHIIRSNLLAASFCIEAALPLLRLGTAPHLVGIASPVTYLTPSRAEGDGKALRQVFESVRSTPAAKGIDVMLVTPDLADSAMSLDDGLSILTRWSADAAASYILAQMNERPDETTLPAASMTALWPLPSSTRKTRANDDYCQLAGESPIKGQL
ncbi:SDR family NAD(P)-dependent oxidoreductase [Pseudomonas frederiksbergensis]|jgi:NAD(P)-dependent dehydrogenase (short-subunit alcohol dehydrogenase family)|nr:SDR family NAD(P)-dependent oxidoreductase [Pseudomonas frederiksbergensis]